MSRPPLPTFSSADARNADTSTSPLSSPPFLAAPVRIPSSSSPSNTRRPSLPPIRPSAPPASSPALPSRPSNFRTRSVALASLSPTYSPTDPFEPLAAHPSRYPDAAGDAPHTTVATTGPGLPPPFTTPAAPGPVSAIDAGPGSDFARTPGRSRAHTVSVSLRSAKPNSPQPLFGSVFTRGGTVNGTNATQNLNDNSPRVSFDVEAGAGTAGHGHGGQGLGLGVPTTGTATGDRRRSSASSRRRSIVGSAEGGDDVANEDGELHDEVVGLLDCVDPTVGTVNHLQNMTNSIIFPHIPQLWTRRPNLTLPDTPTDEDGRSVEEDDSGLPLPVTAEGQQTGRSRGSTFSRLVTPGRGRSQTVSEVPSASIETATGQSVALNTLTREEFAREMDDDISELEKEHELDRHVKHVLSKKQSRIDTTKRILRGVWAFLKTPMGAFTAIYGFLVAFWGAAIVLFLLGWIHTSSKYRQDVWVEISSQVENGLFTLTGVGLIPWRIIDTYRMSVIHTLKMKTIRLRKKQGLPPIEDPDDLPDPRLLKDYVSVLTEKEQEQLRYQQEKFAKSQTWYRAHATATHRAFPIKWALWNTILMDGNSFFQCLLCGCMWGMNWHVRPPWTTGCLIPLSFLCGIGAAVLIWQGSVRTKKTIKVEDKLREALGVPLAIAQPLSATTRSEKSPFSGSTKLPRRRTITAGEAPEVVAGDVEAEDGVDRADLDGVEGLKHEHHEHGKRRITISAPQREPGVRSLDRKAAMEALQEDKTVVEEEEEAKDVGNTTVAGVTTPGV